MDRPAHHVSETPRNQNSPQAVETNEQTRGPAGPLLIFGADVDRIKKFRDLVIILGAVLYGAGLLVWSVNAWMNNLGFLPALDFQYFVAGVVPVGIVGGAYLLSRLILPFFDVQWPNKTGPDAKGWWRLGRWCAILLWVVAFGGLFFFTSPTGAFGLAQLFLVGILLSPDIRTGHPTERPFGLRGVLLLITSLLLLCLAWIEADRLDEIILGYVGDLEGAILPYVIGACYAAVLFTPRDIQSKMFGPVKVAYIWLVLGLACLLGIVIYIETFYPHLPQELGGVRPRYAFVDIDPAALSRQTREALLPDSVADSTTGVVRSDKLAVYYNGNSILMVRPATDSVGAAMPVFELKRGDLKSITWSK